MAELVVFNLAKSLLEQLSSPAKDELLLWYNSKTELEKLKNTVISIRDVLQDAEQRQTTDAAVKTWLSRLRDEMYEADDLFDSISTRALRRQVMSGNRILKETKLLFSKPKDAAFNISTAHKVKELRGRMDGIAKDINQFGFIRRTVADERPVVKRKAQSHSYIPGDELIGREEEKGELLRLLLEDGDDAKPVSVIAVVGIGGQGKTSLAQHLYNAKETEEFFGLRLWACVNDFSDLKVVLEEVTGVKTVGLDELQNILRKKIHGKRFLLVLDDVWDDIRERWLGLKRLLDAGDRGSKILITTRLPTVAQNLGTGTPYYNLRGLSDEHAWLLFQKMAFENDQEKDYQGKEEIGRKIVKKCANVPLAIRTIASYLYSKDKKHWSELLDDHVMNTTCDHPQNMIMDVLKISYDDLPSSLKHCFAYCSLFPKDHSFDKTTLIHLWMAQGLLQTSDVNKCLEDVGERYFEYLVQRCFFQDIREDKDDGRTVCKMHDLFHDMAVQIGGTECVQMKKPEDIVGKLFRHLLVCDIEGLPPLHGSGIRSLVSPFTGFAKESFLDEVFLKFTSLRTLSLRHLDVDKIPSSIGNLVHLRYLDLQKSVKLKRLPDALCKLHNMLILRLGGCSSLINLPDGLHKLLSLRFMEIEGCWALTRLPSGLEQLTSLVILDRLVVSEDDGGLRYLKQLNNLTGALRIELPKGPWKNCVVDAEESMIRCKTKLEKLCISFISQADLMSDSDEDALLNGLQPANTLSSLCIESFNGGKFPNWLSSLTNLAEMKLWGCSNCVELPRLRELYQLRKLTLGHMDLVEYVASDTCYHSKPFFPALESLSIRYMPRLKGWESSNVGEVCFGNQLWFPRLSDLKLRKCPQLTCFPLCPVVETLSLSEVNVKVVEQLLREPQTREDEANNCVDLPSSSTLSGIQGLALLPDEFKLLHALRDLNISDCPNMKRNSMFCSLQHLPSLEFLSFKGSSEIELHDDETSEMEEGMPWISLTRLKVLDFEFGSDPKGAHLIKGLHHLTMLHHLTIYKNVADEFDTQWTAPPNVTSLRICCMNKIACLNGLIQQLKRLHYLTFFFCNVDEHELDKLPWEALKGLRGLTFSLGNMKSLPEKCRHLTSLESLVISYCKELCSLPTWVSQLTSLRIHGCGEVEEKCRKPVGSYWPLIRDIPHISIGH